MKKIVLVLILLLLLVGCEKKEKTYEEPEAVKKISLVNRSYYDKNHLIDIGSVEEIGLNSDNSVFYRKCGEKGTCDFYLGVFEIEDNKLIITINKQQSRKNNKWEKLNKPFVMEFDIIDNNTFASNVDGYEREFVLE